MHYTYYASDILESAMELAQSKAINSYSFRDCMNWLTELWQNCYERITQIDDGYYSRTVQITKRLTRLPPFVRSAIKIYSAENPLDEPRYIYKASALSNVTEYGTYHISGFDLYVPDAEQRIVWLNYTPEPPFITFTKNNRDPRILDEAPPATPANLRYGPYMLSGDGTEQNHYKMTAMHNLTNVTDVNAYLVREGFTLVALILDYPYIFVSYEDNATNDWESYIIKDLMSSPTIIKYNPFDYQGRGSFVKFLTAKWNDYTGMGVVIEDQAVPAGQKGRFKELGWTPDTEMTYPSPIMRNYMVAHLARKFADLNGSQLFAVENEVTSADYQLANFLDRDKSAWFRMDKTMGPTLGDLL